jgi:hypothetical protein
MKTAICLGVLLLAGQSYAFDKSNMRPIAELQLMNESELVSEARKACSELAIRYKVTSEAGLPEYARLVPEASQYLNTISLVARQKNNGNYPDWYMNMLQASNGKDWAACSAAESKFTEEEKLRESQKEESKKNLTEEKSTSKKKKK